MYTNRNYTLPIAASTVGRLSSFRNFKPKFTKSYNINKNNTIEYDEDKMDINDDETKIYNGDDVFDNNQIKIPDENDEQFINQPLYENEEVIEGFGKRPPKGKKGNKGGKKGVKGKSSKGKSTKNKQKQKICVTVNKSPLKKSYNKRSGLRSVLGKRASKRLQNDIYSILT